MGVDLAIRDALAARLASLAFVPPMPVAWENVKAEPTATGWMEAQLFRSSIGRTVIGNDDPHRRIGFLQVAVMMPLDQGAGKADAIAEAVQAHFPCGLRFSDVFGLRITATPHIVGGFPDDNAWWRVPLTIPYEALAA